MKDSALSIAAEEKNPRDARNKLREYLQHVILRELFEQNILESLVFHGGTALRILHNLRRFSEDLDFHIREDKKFDLEKTNEGLKRHLPMHGYQLSSKEACKGIVKSVFVKFEGILYEAGITDQRGEKLSVKIEVDMKPPEGFKTESSLINKYFPFGIIHHDKSSFLAGKLHAVLQRTYTKGRDYYDVWFYLSRWKDQKPNLSYLNSALKQTEYNGPYLTEGNWRKVTSDKIKEVDWEYVLGDVESFLENQSDLKLFTKQIILKLLQ